MVMTADAVEMAADHEQTLAALVVAFGDDGHEMAARATHRYRTTFASWRDCVDHEVRTYMSTRYGV